MSSTSSPAALFVIFTPFVIYHDRKCFNQNLFWQLLPLLTRYPFVSDENTVSHSETNICPFLLDKILCLLVVGKPTPGHLGRPPCRPTQPSLSSPSSRRDLQNRISAQKIRKDLLKAVQSHRVSPKKVGIFFSHKICFFSLLAKFSLTLLDAC